MFCWSSSGAKLFAKIVTSGMKNMLKRTFSLQSGPNTKGSHSIIALIGLTLYLQVWRSQIAEKATHIKGRLLDQAMIIFNCIPFQMITSLKGRNLLPEGANSFLYEPFLIVWKITFITLTSLECYYFHYARA